MLRVIDMKLLYAEDEVSMSEAVKDILEFHSYMVDAVYDEKKAAKRRCVCLPLKVKWKTE